MTGAAPETRAEHTHKEQRRNHDVHTYQETHAPLLSYHCPVLGFYPMPGDDGVGLPVVCAEAKAQEPIGDAFVDLGVTITVLDSASANRTVEIVVSNHGNRAAYDVEVVLSTF